MSTWSTFEPKGLRGIWDTSCWHSGRRGKKVPWERKGWDETLAIGECQLRPTNKSPSSVPAHAARSLFVAVMILHQVPAVRAEARPVIKMKWAADPMVPFRRVEHWPRDLYLIDQPVQREKKSSFPPERLVPHSTALFQSEWKKKEML